MKTALIATDFSDEAHSALRRAVSIAGETRLHGAHAHVLADSLPSSLHVRAASQAQQALARIIVDCEREVGAQLVVLGKHACGLVEQVLIGSVALQVLERAQGDVRVVPD